ncbi:hypothetical protein GCM10010329_85930 [Streptomyces spiroverticillatus]|uniref:Uncharacterized protein n=1 Tax=Streptomyces finlayi TaxID=67296 RepID=A0A919CG20_9ACTN|nr:hypothetical protein GCM10010329_85930 [Streptomyces spiroverticillatus]GHD19928.1 hypothetical protein GCM10010334_83960 [Streptomyces finlayi]
MSAAETVPTAAFCRRRDRLRAGLVFGGDEASGPHNFRILLTTESHLAKCPVARKISFGSIRYARFRSSQKTPIRAKCTVSEMLHADITAGQSNAAAMWWDSTRSSLT